MLDSNSYKAPHSEKDFNYNCLAFALGDVTNWWEPPRQFGHYWPPGFPDDVTVETAVSIIKSHGYTVDWDPSSRPETDSIAVYAVGAEWAHFAKFSSGVWFSKLGSGNDIIHAELKSLEGDIYGKVVRVLSRRPLTPE